MRSLFVSLLCSVSLATFAQAGELTLGGNLQQGGGGAPVSVNGSGSSQQAKTACDGKTLGAACTIPNPRFKLNGACVAMQSTNLLTCQPGVSPLTPTQQ